MQVATRAPVDAELTGDRSGPTGMPHVMWRSRLRWGSAVGGSPLAIAPSGRWKSGVEICVSIRLFGLHLAVAEVEERLPADEAPRRPRAAAQVDRIGLALAGGSKIIPKNGVPSSSPARFARYDGRTMLWPKRYAAPWNSTGMKRRPAGR